MRTDREPTHPIHMRQLGGHIDPSGLLLPVGQLLSENRLRNLDKK